MRAMAVFCADPQLLLGCYGALVLLLLWMILDFRGLTRFIRVHYQLFHEGRWDELEAHFQRRFRGVHPWSGLLLRLKGPGSLDTLYATFLYQRGRFEEGLRTAEWAAHRARGHATSEGQALAVQDDSHLHAGHAGAREGRHFSLRIVSERFNGLSRVARHRLVYDSLHDLIPRGIHALAIDARAPGEP